MVSWDEVRAHLRAKYDLLVDEAAWAGMEWTFRHDDVVVRQRLKVERAAALGCDWALVIAAVCHADKIAPLSARSGSARLAIGSLAVDRDRCYLRAALPLDTLSLSDLDRAIEVVARESARLRDPALPGEKQAASFGHYDD
jgi:hypothetical protein